MDRSGTPIKCIPRDAGFLSVFNFYIGSLVAGKRYYPYWNKEEFLKIHKQIKHFAYMTDVNNSWLHYFEPVQFYENDTIDISTLKETEFGLVASPEFRVPSKTKEHFLSPNFQEWRIKVHSVFSKYIKIQPRILELASPTLYRSSLPPSSSFL